MNRILNIGRTGLNSVQRKMDSIADDVANVNTYGYKKKKISFQELLRNQIHANEVLLDEDINNTTINMGSRSGVTGVDFQQGPITSSPGQFDMAIEGVGFFGLLDQEGNLSLTRNGAFYLDSGNRLVNDKGYYLDIDYYIPPEEWGTGDINISSRGELTQVTDTGSLSLGRVVLYHPDIVDSLTSLGEGRFLPGENIVLYNSIDDEEIFGNIRQYALENSNVDLTKALVEMIISQRSYSINLKSIQTTDDIMSIINNIK